IILGARASLRPSDRLGKSPIRTPDGRLRGPAGSVRSADNKVARRTESFRPNFLRDSGKRPGTYWKRDRGRGLIDGTGRCGGSRPTDSEALGCGDGRLAGRCGAAGVIPGT